MNRLMITLMLLATSASAAPTPAPAQRQNVIEIERDSQRGVTCYILNGVGISCVPDSQIKPEPKAKQTQAQAYFDREIVEVDAGMAEVLAFHDQRRAGKVIVS